MTPIEAMDLAVEISRSGPPGHPTSPLPKVGAVALRDEHLLAQAHRTIAPSVHAEEGLLSNGEGLEGATVYVTLMPCANCAGALIAAGVAEVVIGIFDPNPAVGQKSVKLLKEAGVRIGTFTYSHKSEIRAINEDFINKFRMSPLGTGTGLCDCSGDGKRIVLVGNETFVVNMGGLSKHRWHCVTHGIDHESAHAYVYAAPIGDVALASGRHEFAEVLDPTDFFPHESHYVTLDVGHIAILKGSAGFLLVKLTGVETVQTGAAADVAKFTYEYRPFDQSGSQHAVADAPAEAFG